MTEQPARTYLDNAATSYPKPDLVYAAVDDYQRHLGGAVGRGATSVGAEVQNRIDRCRNRVAKLLDVSTPSRVVFTLNGTDSLNLALHGLLEHEDHVVTTCWEHNSILRPLNFLAKSKGVTTTLIGGDGRGGIDLKACEQALQAKTKLVCLTHASNVTGVIQPVETVVEMAHAAGALVLLDAAQTVGHLPVSMKETGADLIAAPAHKGLLGPLGTGVLAIAEGVEEQLGSLRQGGTGSVSESEEQPESLPEKYESGNHNAPGLFGLEAALGWLEQQTVSSIQSHEQQRIAQFLSGLESLPGIDVVLPDAQIRRVGVVSLNAQRLEPQVLASLLDEHFGIETRAGLHCAPRAHAAIGTQGQGGTVRFSFGPFTTSEDIDRTLEALAQITSAM